MKGSFDKLRTSSFGKAQDGQTLIEVLVALGTAVVVLSATVAVVISALNNAQFSKNQNIATQYAQQGMEVMRKMRNSSSNSPIFIQTNAVFIQTNVGCGNPAGLTPGQLCQREVATDSLPVVVSGTTVAKGYWWRQCGGASISNCNGLDCTVNDLDCTNVPGYWSSQNPYPNSYIMTGTSSTIFDPDEFGNPFCGGYAPGWTVRVYCSRPPTAETSIWTLFSGYGGGSGVTVSYCLDQNSTNLLARDPNAQGCNGQNVGIYARRVDIVKDSAECGGSNQTKVTVSVSWASNKCTDTNNLYCHKVELVSCLGRP